MIPINHALGLYEKNSGSCLKFSVTFTTDMKILHPTDESWHRLRIWAAHRSVGLNKGRNAVNGIMSRGWS